MHIDSIKMIQNEGQSGVEKSVPGSIRMTEYISMVTEKKR